MSRVTFGWDLCYKCNYRCPYCGIWNNDDNSGLGFKVQDWEKFWNRIYEKYGSCLVYMSGGEPSVHPLFYQLIEMLTKMHKIDICTNLSWDVQKVIEKISPEQMSISATFHPTFADYDEFIKKVMSVREYLSHRQVFYVAYPGQIGEMPERSKKFMEIGIRLVPLPLRGDGYVINNEEEKKIIETITPYKGDKIDYQLQRISPQEKLCRAGHKYGVIRVDGTVDRCSQYRTGEIGKITDCNFELMKRPAPCSKQYCPIESQWIIG